MQRFSDGSIAERRDRPGYSKNWSYDVQVFLNAINDWETVRSAPRLDQAIQATLGWDDARDVQIVQVTVTSVWRKGTDIEPIGKYPDDMNMFGLLEGE